MSFGFSVGDFIAISGLIRTLVDALDSNTGSRAQYSRLSDELKSLHSAFLAVEGVVQKLRRDEKSHASTINAITYEIGCCRKLILGFTADTEKYRKSLRHSGSSRKAMDTWRKISYKIFKEEDVVMLKDSLGRGVGVINIYLQATGIHSAFSLEDKVSGMELIIRQQYPKIPKELGGGIEGSIILQDALGRTFPVPLVVCATLEMFHGFLELSFRGLPGHQKVISREYSVSDEKSQKDFTATEWVENITSGRLVSMSMLFHHHMGNAFKSKCPKCKTPGPFSAGWGSRRWTQCKFCQLWTQQTTEYRARAPAGTRLLPSPLRLCEVSAFSKELSSFRRVKIVGLSADPSLSLEWIIERHLRILNHLHSLNYLHCPKCKQSNPSAR
ncbi:hypothetical protein B9Z19DRAFT_989762 [Tuber borchii]|uniref:Ubiquitin-like domain-containing protein n=1 Tax=Tuber borchii TaxID=42251 RepID=A0A2T6ZMF7_TUBBO|nr:hypothetical protein B9Z19DRAFT_989762 [Tuber borchii]